MNIQEKAEEAPEISIREHSATLDRSHGQNIFKDIHCRYLKL